MSDEAARQYALAEAASFIAEVSSDEKASLLVIVIGKDRAVKKVMFSSNAGRMLVELGKLQRIIERDIDAHEHNEALEVDQWHTN